MSSDVGDLGPWMICATVHTLDSLDVPSTWHLILSTKMFIGWVPEGSLVSERYR